MRIFLSFSFNHGHELTRAVERLLASHEIVPDTGRQLGGAPVDSAVEGKILETDALISLFTKRPNPAPGDTPFSQAVQQEYYIARNAKMRAIAVVENGLNFQNMSNNEQIKYDPATPLETILKLAETIAEWRRTMGQELKVQILPVTLADKLENDEMLKCSYALLEKDIATPWKEVPVVSEEAGTFIYVRGVKPGQRIRLRVVEPPQKVTWQSQGRLPWPMVQLTERQNG